MCDSLSSEIRFSLISQNLLLVLFFLERDYACPRMKCCCQCVAGRPVPGSSLSVFFMWMMAASLLSDHISYQPFHEQHAWGEGSDPSWWQLSTDQDCSLVEHYSDWVPAVKRLGLDAWTVELVSSTLAPAADGRKNSSWSEAQVPPNRSLHYSKRRRPKPPDHREAGVAAVGLGRQAAAGSAS